MYPVRLLLASACAALPLSVALADDSGPAAARFYPLVGHWKGNGQMSEPGQAPVALELKWDCRKASAGSAVLCEMTAKNDKMLAAETDLFGVDPVTGKGHWFAVTNQGETHDHVAEWTDATTMKARFAWTQDGKAWEENVSFKLTSARSIEFRSVVTANRAQVGSFSGRVER